MKTIEHQIIEKQKEYIKLLEKELEGLAVFAHVTGWRSTLVEEGKKMRNELAIITSQMEQKQSGKIAEEILEKYWLKGSSVKKAAIKAMHEYAEQFKPTDEDIEKAAEEFQHDTTTSFNQGMYSGYIFGAIDMRNGKIKKGE